MCGGESDPLYYCFGAELDSAFDTAQLSGEVSKHDARSFLLKQQSNSQDRCWGFSSVNIGIPHWRSCQVCHLKQMASKAEPEGTGRESPAQDKTVQCVFGGISSRR